MALCSVRTRASTSAGAWRSVAAGAAAGVCAGSSGWERPASCVTSTHPRMTPKHIPATANATDSAFMNRMILVHHQRPSEPGPSGRPEDVQVLADAAVEPHKHRAADQGVPDRHLLEVGQRSKQDQVVQVQIVTGVDAQAERVCELSGGDILTERHVGGCRSTFEGARERLRIE